MQTFQTVNKSKSFKAKIYKQQLRAMSVSTNLSESTLQSFYCAKLYENDANILAMDVSKHGSCVVSCNARDQINFYDCTMSNMNPSPFNSFKYGVDLIRFANATDRVVYSSTKLDHSLRYLDLSRTHFIAYLKGHTAKVTSLCMSPVRDLCLSGSQDRTVRLWDMRTCNSQAVFKFNATPIANFDSDGRIFAAITRSTDIELFDMRAYDKMPYVTFKLHQERLCDWTGLKYSPDNQKLLLHTNGTIIRMLNPFNGRLSHIYKGFANRYNINIEPCFTPDSKYVICGSTNGFVHMWDANSDRKICRAFRDRSQTDVIKFVRFNSGTMMFAAAGDKMGFWVPRSAYRHK